MADPFLLSVAKAIVDPIVKLLGATYTTLRRPAVKGKRAPKNLFVHVKPGASVARVREVLGTPHQQGDGQYRYTFADARVQIDSADGITVDTVSVALASVTRRSQFQIWPMQDLVLGRTTFASVLAPEDEIWFDYSSKYYHFYVTKYFGFPGLYWTYGLGYLACPGVLPDKHHWSPKKQSRDEIPQKLKINWACVSRLPKPPPFAYYGFL
jgi:hypothetical protein